VSDRPLRIMFVINSLGAGGAERSLAELAPALAGAGHEPIIMTFLRRTDGFEQEVRDRGIAVEQIPGSGLPSWTRSLHRRIRLIRPDVVHTAIFEADVTGRVAGVRTGVPVVTSLINMSYGPERLLDPNVRRWKLRVVREIDGWTARRLTTHFHAVSQSVKDAAVRTFRIGPERVTVIERGRDPGRLGRPSPERRRRVRSEQGIPENAEVVLAVGRLEHQKGHRHLIDAVARLADRSRLLVLIAGRDGHKSADLKHQVRRLGLDGSVRFLGHRDDVPDLLAAADLLALPSLNEGAAGAAIEAMALGLPVVASDLAPLREAIEDGASGLLLPVASPDALAGAIAQVLEDRSLAGTLGARGREIFEQRFTLDRSVERMVEMYRAVVVAHPAVRPPVAGRT
jgi:glycosyltransferase involved in cell wall biosynthesis